MLVVFPLAFLTGVLPADILFLVTGSAAWAWLGYLLSLAGAACGALAALVGAVDLLGIDSVRRLPTAWSHALAGLLLLAVAVAGTLLRSAEPMTAVWPLGVLLSSLQVLLVGIAGWLGGTLTFRHCIGISGVVDPTQRSRDT